MIAEAWGSVEDVEKHLGQANDSGCRWIDTRSGSARSVERLRKFEISEIGGWVRVGGASADDGATREALSEY